MRSSTLVYPSGLSVALAVSRRCPSGCKVVIVQNVNPNFYSKRKDVVQMS